MTTVLSVIYCIIGFALAAIILIQEGKSEGLGSIGGMADSYWGKIKGRSMSGNLERITKVGIFVFAIFSIVLNILMG